MPVLHDDPPNATVARLCLGGHLEQLRCTRGLTLEQVATTLYVSTSKLCRIERGRHRASVDDVARLADFYQAHGPERDRLLEWTRLAQGRSVYHSFADVADASCRDYLDVEAAGLRAVYMPQVLPAVLRTASYARELLGPVSGAEADRRLWLMRLRQQRFLQTGSGAVRVLLGEGALAPGVGGPEVMREQHRRLLHAPVEVRVLAGHRALRASAGFSVAVLDGGRLTLTAREGEDGRPSLSPDRKGRTAARFEELWQAACDFRVLAA
ncbi:Scr1 family TA system antitoxin-like transcriptional regulator [Streptomyces sp. NPDC056883]|uniref:Scr1 family TA system antitoxin-like transcriptional regulator n=1 Tax=Streptomyces sp. NPDC056883 TaxID=3345959 RepID=UPI0036BEA1B4